jgi:predicted P-loop ATPase
MADHATNWMPEPRVDAAATSIDTGWKARLLLGKQGGVRVVVANAITALRYAPDWQGVLHFNESSMCIVARAKPPFEVDRPVSFAWTDEHDIRAAAWLQQNGISVNKDVAGQAVQVVARDHPFHPIRDYLDTLKWDGIERIDDWLTLYLGVDPSDYTRAVGSRFLIGAVARVYQPGVKHDTCPIFEGAQGALKSTALRTLAGDDFFSDDIADLGSKDSVMQTRGVWIIELSELDAMSRSDCSRVKAFMSRQVDRIRPPYGRRIIESPRECVFAGTVNRETYLKDETGARRFWPVKCGVIDIASLRRDRDQLWAEACHRYRSGANWWLDDQLLVDSAAEETRLRYEEDPWDEIIAKWVQNPKQKTDLSGHPLPAMNSDEDSVTVNDILIHCIGKRPDALTQWDQNRVARWLKNRRWVRFQVRDEDGSRPRRYRRPGLSPVSPVRP